MAATLYDERLMITMCEFLQQSGFDLHEEGEAMPFADLEYVAEIGQPDQGLQTHRNTPGRRTAKARLREHAAPVEPADHTGRRHQRRAARLVPARGP